MFVACELAGRVSYEFDEIDYIIGQFEWYSFSHELQKMVPFITMNAQQEVAFQCFGSHNCNRETFKKVNTEIEDNYKQMLFSWIFF